MKINPSIQKIVKFCDFWSTTKIAHFNTIREASVEYHQKTEYEICKQFHDQTILLTQGFQYVLNFPYWYDAFSENGLHIISITLQGPSNIHISIYSINIKIVWVGKKKQDGNCPKIQNHALN